MLLLFISVYSLIFLISAYKIIKGYNVLNATPAYAPKSKFKMPINPKQDLSYFPPYHY